MILGTLLINTLSTQQPGSKRFCQKTYVKHCGISEIINIVVLSEIPQLFFEEMHELYITRES